MSAGREENVEWVDGLRGIASLLVVFTHLTRAFDPLLFSSTSAADAAPRLFQLPIIRLLIQGRSGVPIFSLVTGYVCALKPIRLYVTGNQERALKSITQSAFRRIPRLVLPTSIATVGIWIMTELGAFQVTKHVNSWWLVVTSPTQMEIGPSFLQMLTSLLTTWTRQSNDFDINQWTLCPLLKGAYLVYMMLFATAYVKPKYRMMIEMGLVVYYYSISEADFGMQFFFGAFLCDLSQYPPYIEWISVRKWPGRFLSPILVLTGLIFASYPEINAEWMSWSNAMLKLSYYIFPASSLSIPGFYTGIGLIFISLGLHFSDFAKTLLSNKYLLWAGKNSFAVYLLHGTLLRSVLVWMMYGIKINPDIVMPDGTTVGGPHLELGRRPYFYACLVIWIAFQYYLANLWTCYVDPFCASVTKSLETRVFQDREEKSVLPH